jgi:hypothetical protein
VDVRWELRQYEENAETEKHKAWHPAIVTQSVVIVNVRLTQE